MAADSFDDIQFFNRWARTYERSLGQPFFGLVHRAVLDLASRHLRGVPPAVLDIGCGTGRLLRAARGRWPSAQLIGVDPAEAMIDMARSAAPAATFLVGSAESLPLPAASVDLALSTVSFHHWGDQAAGVREVARVLRPGGVFLLADVNFPGFLSVVFSHFGRFDRRSFRGMCEEAGLRVEAQPRRLLRLVLVTVGVKEA